MKDRQVIVKLIIIWIDGRVKDKQEIQKSQVFNVIILDRSGSMECIRQAAVDGYNSPKILENLQN